MTKHNTVNQISFLKEDSEKSKLEKYIFQTGMHTYKKDQEPEEKMVITTEIFLWHMTGYRFK